MCEDFAPRNGAARAREEGGANRALEKPAAGPPTPKSPVRGSRPETESGKTSANHAGRRASNPEKPGPRFAPRNRKQRASGESSANRAGRRASNTEIPGPRFAPENRKQRVSGESSANHGGRRASGGPLPMPGRPNPPGPPRFPAGPSHFRPVQSENTGRQPGVYSCVPGMVQVLRVKVPSRVFTAKCSEPQAEDSNV